VQATVAMLGGRFRLSRRGTSGVMGQVTGVPTGIGSVDALCQATGEALAPVNAALVATLPTAPLLHDTRRLLRISTSAHHENSVSWIIV